MRSLLRPVVPVLLVLALGACTTTQADDDSSAETGASPSADAEAGEAAAYRYVALGDSYTAAPFVPTTDIADGCLRSNGNYPALLAAQLEFDETVDVSCSAAATRDLTRPQVTFQESSVPPQLDAVTPDTDLVTLGLGGNDFGLFSRVGTACLPQPGVAVDLTCADALGVGRAEIEQDIERIGTRLATALERIGRRAPEARVVLVGYPQLVPSEGECPSLDLPAEAIELARALSRNLRDAMAGAAEASGADFVDMYAASEGHDICAGDDAWVNGGRTDQTRALAFHPFPEGQEAVTRELAALLD